MVLGVNKRTKITTLPINLTLNSEQLELVDTFRYLGILIDSNLTLIEHTHRMTAADSSWITALSHVRKYVGGKGSSNDI